MSYPCLSGCKRIIAFNATLLVFLAVVRFTSATPNLRLKIIRITTYGALEEFYRAVRGENNKSYDEPKEDIQVDSKNTICLNILRSGLLEMQRKVPVRLNHAAEVEILKTTDPLLGEKLFPDSSKTEFQNPTVPISVILAEQMLPEPKHIPVPENAFTCVLRDQTSKKYEQVYISEEYKLKNDTRARFLFVNRNGGIILMAVAEEPAKATETTPEIIERSYVEARANKKPADTDKEDPICKKEQDRQIEICGSILGSELDNGRIKYHPNSLNISDGCAKRKIGFVSGIEGDYDEWMLLCSGILEDENESENFQHITYYVSRSYDRPGRVFLFVRDPKKDLMYLKNFEFENVINVEA